MTNNLVTNLNKLTKNKSILVLDKLPNLQITLSTFNIPGISLPSASFQSPFFNKPVYGDKLEFNNLFLNFVVSENLENWLEVFDWMYQLANPIEKGDIDLTYITGTIIIHNSDNKPIFNVEFLDIVPVSLGDMYFSETENSSEDITSSIVFEYEQYKVTRIPQ